MRDLKIPSARHREIFIESYKIPATSEERWPKILNVYDCCMAYQACVVPEEWHHHITPAFVAAMVEEVFHLKDRLTELSEMMTARYPQSFAPLMAFLTKRGVPPMEEILDRVKSLEANLRKEFEDDLNERLDLPSGTPWEEATLTLDAMRRGMKARSTMLSEALGLKPGHHHWDALIETVKRTVASDESRKKDWEHQQRFMDKKKEALQKASGVDGPSSYSWDGLIEKIEDLRSSKNELEYCEKALEKERQARKTLELEKEVLLNRIASLEKRSGSIHKLGRENGIYLGAIADKVDEIIDRLNTTK